METNTGNNTMIENRNRDISLLGLFGRETIVSLQKKMADVTDFSFSTIDYKGEKVVPAYNQKEYSEYLLKAGDNSVCKMTAAFSAAKAAITNLPYIYECQCGIIKVAVPIVVNDQYIGAIICGGVKCLDPDYIDPISGQTIIARDFSVKNDSNQTMITENIPQFSAVKIKAVAELVFYMIQEICKKETYALKLGDTEHKEVHLGDLRRKNMELRDTIKMMELEAMRTNLHPQFLLNMLETLSSTAILEDAVLTQRIIGILAPFLRYYIEYDRDFITLSTELEYVDNYLNILKIRYGDRVDIRIYKNKEDDIQMIPKLTLFPLAEYMVNFGILNNNVKGIFRLNTEYSIDRCVIFLKFEHTGDYTNGMGYLKESGNVLDERLYLEQLNRLEQRIKYEYANDYRLTIDSEMILLDLPKTVANTEKKK